MTKEAAKDTQKKQVEDGLPDIDKSGDSKASAKKKPPVIFIVLLVVGLAVIGFGIQYVINNAGIFKDEKIVVKEPPMPELTDDDGEIATAFEISSGEGVSGSSEVSNSPEFDVLLGEEGSSEVEQEVKESDLTNSELTEVLTPLIAEIKDMSSKLDSQDEKLGQLINNQVVMVERINEQMVALGKNDQEITKKLDTNERWLGGLSNQLKDIGLKVKVAAQEFPIIVYHKNIWGDDVYLTFAQKNNPSKTSFLRVGDIVGRWKLLKITDDKAMFEHFEGMKKEVKLQ